tara:strand:+ start:270 stop:422 length:153 start_codon:yes stop_codon:yes gene_type:complete
MHDKDILISEISDFYEDILLYESLDQYEGLLNHSKKKNKYVKGTLKEKNK